MYHWGDLGVNVWILVWIVWEEGVYRVLVVKPKGKSPLGKTRRRWVDYIRMEPLVEGGE